MELFENILNTKPSIITESLDPTGAAFNLTKLKGYLRFETTWEHDEDYPEDAMLVDKVHEPPRFTVNWIGPEGKKHPNTYCVNIRKDRGESWTWITHFCLKASDAAEMVNLEVGTWEHNNMPWKFESSSLQESTENHKCLKVKEFYEKLKHINFADEYDYVSVHYAGNYSGLVRNVYIEDDRLVLSAKFEKGGDFNIGFFDIYDALRDFTEDRNTCNYDVVYNVPSMGTYAVLDAEKIIMNMKMTLLMMNVTFTVATRGF